MCVTFNFIITFFMLLGLHPFLRVLISFFSFTSAPDRPVMLLRNPTHNGKPPIVRLQGYKAIPLEVRVTDQHGHVLLVHPVTPDRKVFTFVLPVQEALREGMYQVVVDSINGSPTSLWVALNHRQMPIASQ